MMRKVLTLASEAVLTPAGASLKDVVKVTTFLVPKGDPA